jgi:hypothetical protein
MLFYAGMGIPAGTKSPPGIGDGEGRLPVVVHGDGDGENSPPAGTGMVAYPPMGNSPLPSLVPRRYYY